MSSVLASLASPRKGGGVPFRCVSPLLVETERPLREIIVVVVVVGGGVFVVGVNNGVVIVSLRWG